ncbi:MAG: DUF4175 family protein [Polyangia bacterium]
MPSTDASTPPPVARAADERARAADATIARFLEVTRTRLLSRARLERASVGLQLLVGGTVLAATLRALAPALELRALVVPALLAWIVGLWLAGRETKRRLDALAIAGMLQRDRLPLSDELRSLLELRASHADGAFLVLLAERVATQMGTTPPEAAVPLSAAHGVLRRTLVSCAFGLCVVGLVAPHLLPDAWAALRRGAPIDAGHPPQPIVGDIELELEPPAYTGLPPRTLPSSGGELRVLRGTKVHLRARSLGRTLRAELLLELDGKKRQRLPVKLGSPTAALPTLEADFTVAGPGRYRYVLWRWTGRVVEPEAHLIQIDPDLAPRVEMRVPADPLELSVPRPVELGIEAEDDFGLGSVWLAYRVGDGPVQKKLLTLEQPTPRRAQGRYTWELGELEREATLPPGAKISYWIEAEDNDAVSGKKLGRSRTATITLRAPARPAEVDRANLEQLIEATLGHLADRLDKLTTPEPHGALVALVARFDKVAHATSGSTPALTKLTTDIAHRLDRLAAEESARGAQLADKIVAELERDVLALDDLRGRRRLDDMVRIGNEMKRARDELKRLMEELKTATSDTQKEVLKKEIERKLVELEAKMQELRRASADAEGEVPDEFLNRDAIQKQAAKDQPDDIRKLLAKGDLDKAMSELDRMSKSLDKMTGELERGQKGQREAADPAQEKALGELENELADLAKEERDVQAQAQQIRDKAAERSADKSSLKQLLEKLSPKLAELDRRADEQVREGRYVDREDLSRMRAEAKKIGRALEGQDLEEAQGMALDVRRMAQGQSAQVHEVVKEQEAEAQARVGDGPSESVKRTDRRAAELEQLAREIESELDKTDSSRQPSLSSEEKKQLDDLTKRQQSAQQRGEGLRKKMGSDPSLEGLPQGIGQGVDGARQSMGESTKQLSRNAAGRGGESAGEAAQQLDAARKQVSDARHGGDPNDDHSDGSNQRDEPVRIPGADDSAAPKAFREELLDAMKRGAPKRFEEQVQRYYEELVR